MAFHAADTHRATSEGAARKGRLKEGCELEPRTNSFRLRNRQKLVRIGFENIRYFPPKWTRSVFTAVGTEYSRIISVTLARRQYASIRICEW